MAQVEVVGVRIEFPSNQPVLILREMNSPRFIPLWIGVPEASAISLALDAVQVPRPMTHDLLVDVIANFQDSLTAVTITELQDGIFYALLQFANHDPVSARPSDAIALALRVGAPIFVADEVMDIAGQFITEDEADESVDDQDSELAQFREFLDQIRPEDFS
ncbi:MAG: bifunctional nuclease family protein [Actinomycetes bacterium]